MIGLTQDQQVTDLEYVKKLHSKLTLAYRLARMNLKKSAERQSKNYNQTCHGKSFQVGELCWYARK